MKVKIEVGEPRNFDTGDGTNAIIAEVIEGSEGSRVVERPPNAATMIVTKGEKKLEDNTEYWFAVACSPVSFQDARFRSLLLIPRYRLKRPPLELLSEGEKLVFNSVWRQDGGVWDTASIQAAQDGGVEIAEGMLIVNVTAVKGEG